MTKVAVLDDLAACGARQCGRRSSAGRRSLGFVASTHNPAFQCLPSDDCGMITALERRFSKVQGQRQDDKVPDRDGLWSGQHEEDGVSDFLRFHQASGRERFLHLGLRPVIQQGGHHWAGRDGADADAMLGDLASHSMDEGERRVSTPCRSVPKRPERGPPPNS